MNLSKFLILSLFTAFLFACDKNEDVTPVDPPAAGIPKIKEVYETPDTTLYTYTYDAQGRQIKESYSTGGYTEYSYIDGYVMESWYDENGTLKAAWNYVLDNKGRCTSFTDSRYEFEFVLEYNSEDRISHRFAKLQDGSVYDENFLFYEGGNLVKDSTYYTNGSWMVTTYEYYLNVNSTTGHKNFGIMFWGEDNKNPYKKRSTIRSNNQNQYDNYGIPLLNEEGYIAQKLVTYGNGNYYLEEYTYY